MCFDILPYGEHALERDARQDHTFPRMARRHRTLYRYLEDYGACHAALVTLDKAFKLYEADAAP